MPSQVVFLIDTNVEECFEESCSSLSNTISLSCLRILHFLSSSLEKRGLARCRKLQHTPVKWSYKFFNSRNFGARIESHRLYDFKIKYFEEFENEIQRRFESAARTVKSSNQSKPSDMLSLALMQLLADFQWESPDITSPVKGRRHKKEPSPEFKKFAVVFTKCPKNALQLKQFCGKQVLDSDVLLDSLLPGTLFKQFCTMTKINLHWIDTQHVKYYVSNI